MSRPRTFCEVTALDRALEVFWRSGYEGASISALTEAMGINRPSLYATYGNKEELFQKALARYVDLKNEFFDQALAEPTAREMVAKLLYEGAAILTDPEHPVGCLSVQGALACTTDTERVHDELAKLRATYEARLRQRFEEECRDGRLPPGTDPEVLARFVTTVSHGMSVQASGGATCEQLREVAKMAMRAWPVPDQA
ncbi:MULTISPECIES: TetR/AcrR family transcriptional regulator [Thalassobaculum]|uniref:Transcriptional regulator, TetR family n=1 Tax=Thalassobaculum litoreum DSM 18839 TaxID=1123362 RepID=A0A8G2BL07_9PROT|nr:MULTISPECIES: TetR/AcrR family transcriptional regulator [Thalassobaculum]SDG09180.1 transcriptional regulator, TetR family [Thalassobaculum litoreum DSM 18839]